MSSFEKVGNKNLARGSAAALLAVLALAEAGCGGGGKGEIPKCPRGVKSTFRVDNQYQLLSRFQNAGKDLLLDFKTEKNTKRKLRLGIAVQQLFHEGSGFSLNIYKAVGDTSTDKTPKEINPASYKASSASELMCQEEIGKDKNKEVITVLSPTGLEYFNDLKFAGEAPVLKSATTRINE